MAELRNTAETISNTNFFDRITWRSMLSFNTTKLYYTKAGVCQGFNLAGSAFTGTTSLTTGGTGNPAFLATVTGSITTKYAIFNTSTCQSAHRIRANAF